MPPANPSKPSMKLYRFAIQTKKRTVIGAAAALSDTDPTDGTEISVIRSPAPNTTIVDARVWTTNRIHTANSVRSTINEMTATTVVAPATQSAQPASAPTSGARTTPIRAAPARPTAALSKIATPPARGVGLW